MSRSSRAGWVALVAAVTVVAASLPLSPASAGPPTNAAPAPDELSGPGLYVVALNSDDPEVRDRVLRRIGGVEVLYRFDHALHGFAADLDREQVKQLRGDRRVELVERSTKQRLDSVDTAGHLGARDAWADIGGADNAGRGTVVGVVDSGIWPENPSFAALPGAPSVPKGFRAHCADGEQWDDSDCNNKVVGARYFVKGFGEDELAASEYLSPRDASGHGSHVAAVAAGNDGVALQVAGQHFGRTSGMAPGARIASYKACWTAPDPADDGCTTADTIAAVDRALADGVDVISYAASSRGPASEAVARALLSATEQGVFVAAPAGNSGPGPGSVAHASPWVTTVGASTHHRFQGAVELGDGERLVGAMVSDDLVPRAPLVLAEDVASPGQDLADARLCRGGSLDAAQVQGRIVVCDRGTIPRVEKSAAVERAGGVGMVLGNVTPDDTAADFHAVPTVHLDAGSLRTVKQYVADHPDPTASIDPTGSDDTPVPQVASFSSRGPGSLGDRGGLLKPDLTAPGVGVLAAVAPPASKGRLWDQRSGTSVSTAHVAGLAAMVMAEHPRWTPAMVKSAMVTTANDLAGIGGPLAGGGGEVDAAEVLDPGLVLDVAPRRYRAWLDGRVPPQSLNLPSIALGDLTGRARVTRRVTNVSGGTETYTAQVSGLDGIDVTVRPQTLQLGPGETGRFSVVFERVDAPLETLARGSLVWTGLSHRARLPIVATPRTVDVPREATGSGGRGSVSFDGTAGTDAPIGLDVSGLAEARPVGLTLEPGDFDPADPRADSDTTRFPIEVPEDTSVLRLELLGLDRDDVDLYLYRDGDLVASAAGSGADEILTAVDPDPGEYDLYVSSAVAANGSTTTSQLYTWVVSESDGGNLTAPASVSAPAGEPFGIELSWEGLDPTSRWFGVVRYERSDERTFVTVN